MKITKTRLKQIIKEELSNVLREATPALVPVESQEAWWNTPSAGQEWASMTAPLVAKGIWNPYFEDLDQHYANELIEKLRADANVPRLDRSKRTKEDIMPTLELIFQLVTFIEVKTQNSDSDVGPNAASDLLDLLVSFRDVAPQEVIDRINEIKRGRASIKKVDPSVWKAYLEPLSGEPSPVPVTLDD